MRLVRLLGLLIGLTAFLPAADACADPYPVTMIEDDGPGSLRAAIAAANEHAGGDTIPIQVSGVIGLETALPLVTEDVAIEGPGADFLTIARAAFASFGIVRFGPGVTASLSGVTVSGGSEKRGAGIFNDSGGLTLTRVVVSGNEAFASGGVSAHALGGGVYSKGALTLRESTVRDNTAIAEENGFFLAAMGGGVYASGPLIVDRSTISDNHVRVSGGVEEVVAQGGGLEAAGEGAEIERSTVSGNSAFTESPSGVGFGGGIEGKGVTLTSSTIVGNFVGAGWKASGANLDLTGSSLVRNSIVSEPQGGAESCSGAIGSDGFNLDEDGSCEFGRATDLDAVVAGIDPMLRSNGGPTPTHALLTGSAAIDRGNSFKSQVDQRGLPRPSDFASISDAEGGDGSDIGAFELQAPPAPGGGPVLVSAVPSDTSPPNTRIVSGPPRIAFKHEAQFRFASSEAQSSFQCKVDRKQWRGCRNPYKGTVKPGKHLFKVRAIDRFGNADPTPARFGWWVKPLSG